MTLLTKLQPLPKLAEKRATRLLTKRTSGAERLGLLSAQYHRAG